MNNYNRFLIIPLLALVNSSIAMQHTAPEKNDLHYGDMLHKIGLFLFKKGKSQEFSKVCIGKEKIILGKNNNPDPVQQIMLEFEPNPNSTFSKIEKFMQEMHSSYEKNRDEFIQLSTLADHPELKELITHCIDLDTVNKVFGISDQRLMYHTLVTFFKDEISFTQAKAFYGQVPGIAIVRRPSREFVSGAPTDAS